MCLCLHLSYCTFTLVKVTKCNFQDPRSLSTCRSIFETFKEEFTWSSDDADADDDDNDSYESSEVGDIGPPGDDTASSVMSALGFLDSSVLSGQNYICVF